MKLSHINYGFSTEGMNPVLVERHSVFVRERLATLFNIDRSAIHITAKARLPEGVPFSLTCYATRSESCPVAMAMAAKHCLPHLQDMRKLGEDSYWAVALWNPGEDAAKDMEAVGAIAEGLHRGATDTDKLEPEQREWLEHIAARTGAVNSVDSMGNQELAEVVFQALFAMRKQLAEVLQ